MANYRLAVDYGTSNTVAMLRFPDGRVRPLLFDGSPLLPSAVYAQPDGAVLTGRDAQHSARLEPSRYEPNPKRRIDDVEILLGDRSWPVADLAAHTLARVAVEAARTAGGPVTDLVMTCPVEWGPVRRRMLSTAAERARLPRPTLVAEPVAAAAYFTANLHHEVPVGRSVIVYDLGGGTFDVCVVRREATGFEPLAYRGVDDFGGVDLDALVVAQIAAAVQPSAPVEWQRLSEPRDPADRRHFRTLWDDARNAKESLSRQANAHVLVPVVERDVHVSREAFEHAAKAALQRTVDVTMATIREAQVRPPDVAGLFLVGGSTRVPMVATLLHQTTGMAPTLLEQPETVVAEGALRAVAPSTPTTAPVPAPPPQQQVRPQPPYQAAPVPPPRRQPSPSYPPAPNFPPAPKSPSIAIPVIAGALMVLGALILILTPLVVTVYPELILAGCAVGSPIFCFGSVLLWRYPKLPLFARYSGASAHLLITMYWFTMAENVGDRMHPNVQASALILSGVTFVMLLLTTAGVRMTQRKRKGA
ncbi:hypothetical protein Afil01_29970 [Actinorhabdospora filicis]|uniref:Hsp70 protein n=1 Tax=Actinorhabdospora filicis TaxID=1785913 RepID=A0A9W6SJH5_9ACTN|nr:Hsp70 family protein [Actinorhabdospora filicis]GLZ78190.1 hypothetical protein Afil01_29970 [Actinorhabdospora filicis]